MKVFDLLVSKARYLLRKLVRPETIDMGSVRLDVSSSAISAPMRNILYSGKYEVHESFLVAKIIKPGDKVLEIGGGIGYISTLCAKALGSSGNLIVYEADPRLTSIIEKTKRINDVDFEIVNAVLGDGEGDVNFYISENFYSSSLMHVDAEATSIKVVKQDVNNVINDLQPTVMVVDVEGFEVDLFNIVSTLEMIDRIILEIHPAKVSSLGINKMLNNLYQEGFYVDYCLSKGDVLLLKKGAIDS